METSTICIDTNILIDFFRKGNKENAILFKLKDQYNFCISVISSFEIEIGIKSERQRTDYELLINNIKVLPIDNQTIKIAVDIYKLLNQKNHRIELADLLIAATSIYYNIPLATLNKKHFENILNLKLIDF